MPAPLDFAHNGRSFGIEQLHADLHKQPLAAEAIEKRVNRFRTVKIQCNNYLFIHCVPLL